LGKAASVVALSIILLLGLQILLPLQTLAANEEPIIRFSGRTFLEQKTCCLAVPFKVVKHGSYYAVIVFYKENTTTTVYFVTSKNLNLTRKYVLADTIPVAVGDYNNILDLLVLTGTGRIQEYLFDNKLNMIEGFKYVSGDFTIYSWGSVLPDKYILCGATTRNGKLSNIVTVLNSAGKHLNFLHAGSHESI
jgi:hypothetical protein